MGAGATRGARRSVPGVGTRAGMAAAARGCAAATCAALPAWSDAPRFVWRLHAASLVFVVLVIAATHALFFAHGHTARAACEVYREASECDVPSGGMPTISATGVMSPEREVFVAGLVPGAIAFAAMVSHDEWVLLRSGDGVPDVALEKSARLRRWVRTLRACAVLATVGFLVAAAVPLDVQYELHSLGALVFFCGHLGRVLARVRVVRTARVALAGNDIRAALASPSPFAAWLALAQSRRAMLVRANVGMGATSVVAYAAVLAVYGRDTGRMWWAPVTELLFAALIGVDWLIGTLEIRAHSLAHAGLQPDDKECGRKATPVRAKGMTMTSADVEAAPPGASFL